MPAETVLTLEIEQQEVPVLFSQLVQNGTVLDHPAVQQHRPIPQLEQDTYLNLVIQGSADIPTPSDPNGAMTHRHVLSPLAERASQLEQSMVSGPSQVNISTFRFSKNPNLGFLD